MTPKQKAEELVNNNIKLIKYNNIEDWINVTKYAKESSLLSVDEILNLPFEFEAERKYWQEVKQEIEKL